MKDLIERQTVIEAIAYSIELCNKALDSMTLGGMDRYAVEVERNSLLKLKDDFKLLPSAQPDLNEWCTDCKEYDAEKHSCPRFNQVIKEALKGAELEPCMDAVSRKDAIRWVKTECNPYGKPTLDFESGKKVIEYLKQLPSAQPERKKGRWITTSEFEDCYYAKCNQCNIKQVFYFNKPLTNFCPNCGADMRQKNEGLN